MPRIAATISYFPSLLPLLQLPSLFILGLVTYPCLFCMLRALLMHFGRQKELYAVYVAAR